ncbi:MAG: TonB-dependent receptor [Alphaproteobacteria bacterium]
MTKSNILHATLVTAAISFASAAYAQEELETLEDESTPPTTEEAAPASNQPPRGLEEIIVTAQKRKESIKEVPLSVSAISGETIKDLNIEDLNDLSRHTPNLKVQASGIFNFIYIRGLGSGLNAGFEQSVGLFIDGMYYGRNHYLTTAFLDLEQVEVLRGPQGTLFGKNTIAGALNITTGTPQHDWAMDFDIIMGEAETSRITGMVNVPIWEDRIAGRLAGTRFEREGFIFNHHPDRMEIDANIRQHAIRGKLKWDITPDLDTTLIFLDSKASLRGFGDELSVAPDEFLTLFRLFDPETDAVHGDGRNSVNDPSGGLQTSTDFVGHINYRKWQNTFTLIAGFSEYLRDGQLDADFGPSPSLLVTQKQPYDQWSMELRATSDFGERFEYVTGLYYFESNLENPTDTRVTPMSSGIGGTVSTILIPGIAEAITDGLLPDQYFEAEHGTGEFSQFNRSFSVYGQAQYDFFEWLTVMVGARWSLDTKELDFSQTLTGPGGTPGFAPILQVVLQAEEFDRQEDRTEYDFSPKVSMLYRANDDINFYFTMARGNKAGGFNASATREIDISFKPEESITYEGGFKGDFFDGNARLNFGLFRTEFKDLQVSVFNGLEFVVTNADATTQGIEADGMWALPYGFLVVGSFAFLDGTYDDFTNGPCVSVLASSATDSNEDDNGFCDLTGGRLANAPRWQWDISVNWLYQVGNLPFNLYAGYDLFWHGETYFQTDLDPLDYYEGYFMHHARFGLRDLEERWSFTVFVRNVTDEVAVLGSGDVPVYSGTHFVRVDQPRNVAAQFRVNF